MLRFATSLLFFLFVLVGNSASSQSFYELKFQDISGNEYTCFWVYSSESENYMRIAYFNENAEYRVVNVEYLAETGVLEDGTGYFVLLGENPTWVTDAGPTEYYNVDYFVWLKFEGEDYGMPLVTDDPEYAEESFVTVTSYIELDPLLFTGEYLNQFYGTDEEDYITLMALVDQYNAYLVSGTDNTTTDFEFDATYDDEGGKTGGGKTGNNTNTDESQGQAVNMHLVIAANTDIGDIGASCEVDKKNLVSEFEGICEVMKIPLKQYIIDEKDFTKEKLVSTLNSLDPGPNDIVMFVYTGHGFRWSDQSDDYPMLDMRYNPYTEISAETSIGLKEVHDIIVTKGARLNLVFGDCCNSDVGVNQRTSNTFLASRNDAKFNKRNLNKLFLESKGNVLATAASPGQVSWSNAVNGGFFTSSFFQAFREEIGYLDTDPKWEDMINNTIKYAAYKSSKAACSVCTEQNGQKSIFMY